MGESTSTIFFLEFEQTIALREEHIVTQQKAAVGDAAADTEAAEENGVNFTVHGLENVDHTRDQIHDRMTIVAVMTRRQSRVTEADLVHGIVVANAHRPTIAIESVRGNNQ